MSIAHAWQLQDAKSKFSELVESAISQGPQFVTKRGVKSVVVISIDEFNRLKKPKDDFDFEDINIDVINLQSPIYIYIYYFILIGPTILSVLFLS